MKRHGLTLVEVLAATVLLAMVVAVCLPVFTACLQATRGGQVDAFGTSELGQLADQTIAKAEAVGPSFDAVLEDYQLSWPDRPEWPPVSVGLLEAEGQSHAWYRFSSGEVRVYRWVGVETQARDAAISERQQ